MPKVLVKFTANWADELDVYGFKIMDMEQWYKYVEKIPEVKYLVLHIGSNQEIEFYDKNEYVRSFTVKELSDSEYAILHSLFPGDYFGKDGMIDFYDDGD